MCGCVYFILSPKTIIVKHDKKDPGRTRQNTVATAATSFTNHAEALFLGPVCLEVAGPVMLNLGMVKGKFKNVLTKNCWEARNKFADQA